VLHFLHCLLASCVLVTLAACSGGGEAAQPALGPLAAQVVEVPAALAADLPGDRMLNVPAGFGIRVWARVNGARFMALAPNGDVLVSVPGEGRIVLLRESSNDVPQAFEFASGMRRPHDMLFRSIAGITWLYVAEADKVTRAMWDFGQTSIGQRLTVVDKLPDSSSPGLGGTYQHELKNLALGPDDKLYVSIASSCNACAGDETSTPARGAIYQYDADGANGRLFARGLRNAEGLDFLPGTATLWAAVNGRDEVRVPLDIDLDGDGASDLGKLMPAYVDVNPPEQFTAVVGGAHYGWPFCNSIANPLMANLGLLPDFDLNRGGASFDCALVTPASKGFAAHSAPLGFSFLQASNVPLSIRNGAAVAMHGCWNCSALNVGYKVAFLPFDAASNAGAEVDLVTGFVTDPALRQVWGRPVDVIADARGRLLISDDLANVIYQLYPK
jgi:glucose/arabinose dehydrogenase